MPEPTSTDQPDAAKATDASADKPEADAALGDAGKKALDAERKRATDFEKQAKQLQSQLDAINQANESALEKAQRETKEAQDALPTAVASAFKQAAVSFGGITQEDADLFLTGSDVDTLSKQIAALSARTSTPGTPTPAPRPDLSQGATGTPASGDPAQDFANFINGQLAQN